MTRATATSPVSHPSQCPIGHAGRRAKLAKTAQPRLTADGPAPSGGAQREPAARAGMGGLPGTATPTSSLSGPPWQHSALAISDLAPGMATGGTLATRTSSCSPRSAAGRRSRQPACLAHIESHRQGRPGARHRAHHYGGRSRRPHPQGDRRRTGRDAAAQADREHDGRQLSAFADEVTRVAREVGTEGRLGGQAQVRGVSGVWKDLTDNVNFMAGNLTGQVRNIAQVTQGRVVKAETAVSTGSCPAGQARSSPDGGRRLRGLFGRACLLSSSGPARRLALDGVSHPRQRDSFEGEDLGRLPSSTRSPVATTGSRRKPLEPVDTAVSALTTRPCKSRPPLPRET
jgi:hypothetical protein